MKAYGHMIEKTGKAFIFLKQPTKEELWRFKYSVNRGLIKLDFI